MSSVLDTLQADRAAQHAAPTPPQPVPPKPVRPAPTPPARPALPAAPTGPPVPALSQVGFWGSIHDFNQAVQQAYDGYHVANGVEPDPRTLLHLAVQPKPATPLPAALNPAGVLAGLKAAAGFGDQQGFHDYVSQHSDVLDELLRNPGTAAKAQAAFAAADLSLHYRGVQNPVSTGKLLAGTATAAGQAVADVTAWAGNTVAALGKDLGNVYYHSSKGLAESLAHGQGNRGARADMARTNAALGFPHLSKAAPAVAQVVKGLVYSPAGVAETAIAISKDTANLEEWVRTGGKKGSPSFDNTARLAKQVGLSMYQDLQDPSGHAGYLLLDAFGLLSLGAGTAARLGRAAGAVAEGEGAAAGLRAFARPHPLRTVEYSKNGYTEHISLSGNPLTAWLQQHTPLVGTNAQLRRLGGDSNISDRLVSWADGVLGPEARMGRAGNIARATQAKYLAAGAARIQDAAGWAVHRSFLDRITPDSLFPGLTRGEVKAIDAASWDAPGSLSDKIDAEQQFHRDMIQLGFPEKPHTEQIANLELARKAVENPSERLQETLKATLAASAQLEALRMEGGLTADVAAGSVLKAPALWRVARAAADAMTQVEDAARLGITNPGLEENLAVLMKALESPVHVAKDGDGFVAQIGGVEFPVNRQSEDSFFVRTVKKGKSERKAPVNVQLPASVYGIGPPQNRVFNSHLWTGDALRVGDVRIDAHNIVAEDLGKAAKAATVLSGYQRVWDAASETRTSPEDVAIRDIRNIPDDIRRASQSFLEGHISQEEMDSLPAELQKVLYPREEEIAASEHVRYIDPRMLGNLYVTPWDQRWRAMEPGVRAVMGPVNNLARPFMLYGPKYILNLLGNAGMLVFDEGFLRSGQNVAHAMALDKIEGVENASKIRSMVGAGKSTGYSSGELETKLGAANRGLANFWSKLTDNDIRVASWLYYAKKAGYDTVEKRDGLLNDPGLEAARNDVTKRAEDAMVAFDRMSPFEKATLRHVVFVYPWQRGAMIWTFRSLFEHPAKTALLAALGQEAYQDDPWLKEAVDWVRRAGYIPFHWNDTHVTVMDPTSVNTFSTLAQIAQTLKGGVTGDQYGSIADFGSPAANLISHAWTGADANGNPYKGSRLLGAVEEVVNGIPIVAAFRRHAKGEGKPLRGLDITRRDALLVDLNSALKQVVLDPGWLGGFGSQLAGGFSPRQLNLTAAAARYWAHAPAAQKHEHEVDFLMRALALQAEFLQSGYPDQETVNRMLLAPLGSVDVKGKVPEDVRLAVLDAAQLSLKNAEFQKQYGVSMSLKQRLVSTIRYYRDAGRMSGTTAAQLVADAKGLDAVPDINHMLAAVSVKYGHAAALAEWQHRVSVLASFSAKANPQAAANVAARLAFLNQNGLAAKTYQLSDQTREQYGRLYADYLAARDKLTNELRGKPDKADRLRAFDDAHNQPVELGGNALPSLAALRLSDSDMQDAQQQLVSKLSSGWAGLTNADKQALGRRVPQQVSQGWTLFQQSVQATREANGRVSRDDKNQIAAYVEKHYPGFMKDYMYSLQPRAQRILAAPLAKRIPERDAFDYVARNAVAVVNAIRQGAPVEATRRAWKEYVQKTLIPWLQKDHKQLYQWLQDTNSTGTGADKFLRGLTLNG